GMGEDAVTDERGDDLEGAAVVRNPVERLELLHSAVSGIIRGNTRVVGVDRKPDRRFVDGNAVLEPVVRLKYRECFAAQGVDRLRIEQTAEEEIAVRREPFSHRRAVVGDRA